MNASAGQSLATLLVAVATAIVILAVAILPFLTPAWLGFAQDRADAEAWTGLDRADIRVVTNAIVHDLVLGPPAFDVELDGEPVLAERERSHMRDVRGVFAGLGALAAAAAVILLAAALLERRRTWVWRAMWRGALGLVAVTALLAGVAAVAFDAAFEVFHRLFFAGGTYTFDPRTDRLVQLFPDQLWFETTIAVGAVMVTLALVVAWLAGRRARTLDRQASAAAWAALPDSGFDH